MCQNLQIIYGFSSRPPVLNIMVVLMEGCRAELCEKSLGSRHIVWCRVHIEVAAQITKEKNKQKSKKEESANDDDQVDLFI